ncbi:MAG: hypothetical protein ACD_60C00029G0005 [uncultured bacterium]|nr:MAG: hypothetical protein ACD_60C00029G0005 [uncultured bacterium]
MQKFESKIHLSKQYLLLYLTVVLGSVMIIIYLPLNGWLKCFLMSMTMGYGVFIFWKHHEWQAILHTEEGWAIRHKNEIWPIEVRGESTVTFWVSVICFTIPEKNLKRSCVIFNDALEKDHYRQLLVRLRNFC